MVNIYEECINYLHALMPICTILIVFLPEKILKYIWFTPMLFYPLWWFFDGCPLTHASKKYKRNNNWVLDIQKKYLNKKATVDQSHYLAGIWICLSIIFSAFKLIKK
jgi:hypothetical protein